jgi:cytochrome c-type biogenesis protein CcmH/NrfG
MKTLAPLVMVFATAVLAAPSDHKAARELYQRTQYQAAIRVLQDGPMDGPACLLLGQSYYMLGDYKKASEAMEKAVSAQPGNSRYYNWLGRAYGRRAENSSPFTAPKYASKTRQAFERAVELDGSNQEALSDLLEYYLEAPGFLGGGLDKAAKLVETIARLDPAEGHYARFRLAEKRKDFKAAEQQLRRAAELAPGRVGRLIDLAKFLARQGRVRESELTFDQARKVAPDAPRVLFEQANAYIRAGQNFDKARELLKQYLSAQLSPDDPPRRDAEKLLHKAGA